MALIWCVACLKASGRRSFYYDSLLEQMIIGDSIEEHYTVEGQEHARNGTILVIGGECNATRTQRALAAV